VAARQQQHRQLGAVDAAEHPHHGIGNDPAGVEGLRHEEAGGGGGKDEVGRVQALGLVVRGVVQPLLQPRQKRRLGGSGERLGNIQGTFREHSGNVQGILRGTLRLS
jgi:hypothetical protein